MAGEQHILRVRRVDGDANDGYIVIQVTRKTSRALDVDIVASESEHVYVGSSRSFRFFPWSNEFYLIDVQTSLTGDVVKQSGAAKLRANTFTGTETEWTTILERILFQQPIERSEKSLFDGVEAVSSVAGEQITVIIRKNVEGITQRLGSIVLDQNDEEEADFIGWSAIAAQAAQDAIVQVSELQSKFEEQQATIEKLNNQLDDLVKAKADHENDLLQKFTELLNSKKRKIRDQQRLLAGAKVDATTGEYICHIGLRRRGIVLTVRT